MNVKSEFGKKLKSIRKMRNLTQEKFAELANISPGAVAKIERGERFPVPQNLVIFADILSVQIKDFFDFGNESVIDTDNEMAYYFKGLDERGRNYFKKAITLYKEEH